MSISRMSLIEMVAPRACTMELVTAIQDFGVLQLEEVPLVVPHIRSFLHRHQLTDDQLAQQRGLRDAMRILTELGSFWQNAPLPSKAELDAIRSKLKGEDARYIGLQLSRMHRRSDSLLRQRHNIARDIESLERYRQRLDQVIRILDESPFGASMTHVALLTTPGDRGQIEGMEEGLNSLTKNNSHIFHSEASDRKSSGHEVALLAFPEEYEKEVRRLVRASHLPEFRLPASMRDLSFTDAVRALHNQLETLPATLKKVEQDIADFKEQNVNTMILFDQICSDLLGRLEAVEMIAHSDMLAVVHAWIPSSEIPPFEHFARERLDGVLTISQLKQITGDASHVPVRLKNATPFRPFERLLQMFSMPLYGSFDPTLLMAIVFPLFFGLILGDIAYGLFILGLSLWARRRWRHKPIGRDVASMGVACAVSAILFGIIFGEFLGDLGERTGMIPVYIGKFRLMPLWKHRELIINELLGVTICIGFFHIVLGLILGIIESVRMNSRRHLWESAGLLLGLIGVSLFSIISILKVELAWLPASIGLPVSLVALAISTVTLMVFCSPVAPIEIISLVGNVLSYSRLMALGVAGMVLANLANSVAASQSSIVVGIVLAIPIHALAIALGILEPTIHALRLHFVEFLPRFFIGDGRTFSPLQRKDRDHEV